MGASFWKGKAMIASRFCRQGRYNIRAGERIVTAELAAS
jgi:hypothetical protein